MALMTFVVWIVSLVLLAIAALNPRPFSYVNAFATGVFAFDLWVGLQYLLEASKTVHL